MQVDDGVYPRERFPVHRHRPGEVRSIGQLLSVDGSWPAPRRPAWSREKARAHAQRQLRTGRVTISSSPPSILDLPQIDQRLLPGG